MFFTVEVIREDGAVRPVPVGFDDAPDAIQFALTLADDLGRTFTAYGEGCGYPAFVTLSDDAGTILKIRVYRGGLSPVAPYEGLVPLPPARR